MFKLKRIRLLAIQIWQPMAGTLAGVALAGALLIYKIGTLVPGFANIEISSILSSRSVGLIIDNPVNAPYKAITLITNYIYELSTISARLPNLGIALIAAGLFFYIVSKWHSTRVAIFSTALFASSAWYLHFARLSHPGIYLTLLLLLLAYGIWISKTQRSAPAVVIGVVIGSGLLYLPGMVWIVAIGVLWQRKKIVRHVRYAQISSLTVSLLGVILLAPLIAATARDPQILKQLAGLPIGQLAQPIEIVRHILNVPVQLFLRTPQNPQLGLAGLPLLDFVTTALSIIGFYSYLHHIKLERAKIVVGLLIVCTLLVGLRGQVYSIILMPLIYLLAAAGLAYLINQWFGVFPRNPLAKYVGIILITVTVGLSCLYSVKQYFIAWPSAPATRDAFSRQLP